MKDSENKVFEDFISVVIPTYNGEKRLPNILSLFSEQDYPREKFEVIVVDDGSADGTNKFLGNYCPAYNFRHISHEENRGRASACNSGIKEAKGEIVIILDDDMIFYNDFISQHARRHFRKDRIVIVGMIEMYFHNQRTNSAFIKYFKKNEAKAIQEQLNQKKDMLSCSTTNFSIRKNVLFEIGLFDEHFNTYGYEDWELSCRLIRSSIPIIYAPECLTLHNLYTDNFIKFCYQKLRTGYSAAIFYKLHPELAKLLEINSVFIWKGDALEIAKKIFKAFFVNSFTIPFYHILIFFYERIFGFGFVFLYDQVSAYYYRKGLIKALSGEKPPLEFIKRVTWIEVL